MLGMLIIDICIVCIVGYFMYHLGKKHGIKKKQIESEKDLNNILMNIKPKEFLSSDNYDYKQYCLGWNDCVETIKIIK